MSIPVKTFLSNMVEHYLTYDITALKGARVGYPLLMTAFGAIELFGALISAEKFVASSEAGKRYFLNFWTEHLYPGRANTEAVGKDLYVLVRNGIAHSFFPKGAIGVMGPQPWAHLTVDARGLILIDAHTLANDVLGAYARSVRPVAESTDGLVNVHTMQARLNEMLADERIGPAEARLRSLLPPQPMPF